MSSHEPPKSNDTPGGPIKTKDRLLEAGAGITQASLQISIFPSYSLYCTPLVASDIEDDLFFFSFSFVFFQQEKFIEESNRKATKLTPPNPSRIWNP
jgi:hypothetical protein